MAYWYVLWHNMQSTDSGMWLEITLRVPYTSRRAVSHVSNDMGGKSARSWSTLTQLHLCDPRSPCNPSPPSLNQSSPSKFPSKGFVLLPWCTALGDQPSNLPCRYNTVYDQVLGAVGVTRFSQTQIAHSSLSLRIHPCANQTIVPLPRRSALRLAIQTIYLLVTKFIPSSSLTKSMPNHGCLATGPGEDLSKGPVVCGPGWQSLILQRLPWYHPCPVTNAALLVFFADWDGPLGGMFLFKGMRSWGNGVHCTVCADEFDRSYRSCTTVREGAITRQEIPGGNPKP